MCVFWVFVSPQFPDASPTHGSESPMIRGNFLGSPWKSFMQVHNYHENMLVIYVSTILFLEKDDLLADTLR